MSDLALIEAFIVDELQVRVSSYCAPLGGGQYDRQDIEPGSEDDLKAAEDALAAIKRLTALINSPEIADFTRGVELESTHQVERWGANHDAGKTPWDWYWLLGHLAQKAAAAALEGDTDKARHHTISTAAALANWHRALSGGDSRMRPGVALTTGESHRLAPSDALRDILSSEMAAETEAQQ